MLFAFPPRPNTPCQITFDIKGEFRRVAGSAAIADGLRPASPLTFRIDGDDKPLWRSPPLQEEGQTVPFQVSVMRVRKLNLVVECPGSNGACYAVWVDPVLSK